MEGCGEGREDGGVDGLGKLLDREGNGQREKKDMQTEFQKKKKRMKHSPPMFLLSPLGSCRQY